jgi:Fe-S cluster assembly protein SufD
LTGHSHLGGRTIPAQLDSHLHGVGSADLRDHPAPSGKEENWRFTPMRRLRGLAEDAPFQGIFGTDNDTVVQAPANVIVRRVTGDEAVALKGLAGLPTDRPSARAWEASTSVLLIDVPPGVEVTDPVVVTFVGVDAAKASAGHVIVRIGAQSTAQVAMVHEGSATLADNIEIVVGDGATL